MSYKQIPLPLNRRFVPQGIVMRQPAYPRLGMRHRVPIGFRLGASPAASIATSAPGIAAGVGTAPAIAAAGVGGTALGTALGIAIPLAGVAIGAIVGALFAAHEKRVADAKAENQNLTDLIPTVINAITQVFNAANSGQATAAQAIAAMQQIQSGYWQSVQAFENAPGQAGGASSCKNLSAAAWKAMNSTQGKPGDKNPTACNKSCTASCCIGCNVINQWVVRAIWMFQNPGKSDGWGWGTVVGNSYGLGTFTPPNWQYTPPKPATAAKPATTATAAKTAASSTANASPVTSAVSDVASVASTPIAGIPLWAIAAATVGAYLIFK